ncbi:MAG TPA: hypothetical protein VIF62_02380 [Labilithrix sp.]|jgi:hypothetical protein
MTSPIRLASASLLLFVASACSSSSSDQVASGDPENVTGKTKLLDCNVFESGGGPDQQVTVLKDKDGNLTLRELTESGSTEERDLSQGEWDARNIRLRKQDPDEVNTLRKDGRDWVNESRGGGFNVFGYADCATDKSE